MIAVTPYSGKGTTFLLEKPTVISNRDYFFQLLLEVIS